MSEFAMRMSAGGVIKLLSRMIAGVVIGVFAANEASAAGLRVAQAAPAAGTQAAPAEPAAEEKQDSSLGSPATVIDGQSAESLLGKKVQSVKGDDLGRIVDVIVDKAGQIRAAVVDFGGFLGVGSRKIAVDWHAIRMTGDGKLDHLVVSLAQDQLRSAPAYKEGEPVVVMGAPVQPAPAPKAPAAAAVPAPVAPAPAAPAPSPAPEAAPK